ncbi:primase-helicase family protein [Variovorax robiniae]|uniref:Primase-helicase family protein n=1 Tax=Variovorax robiniae TaxID=1836199 RepID=A0ABU8X9J7_9BURK
MSEPRIYYPDASYTWDDIPPEWKGNITDGRILVDIADCVKFEASRENDPFADDVELRSKRVKLASGIWSKLSQEQMAFARSLDAAKVKSKMDATAAALLKERDPNEVNPALRGYTGTSSIDTKPKDWVYAVVRKGIEYYHIADPYRAYPAKVMDERVNQFLWEKNGNKKIKPSVSHLSRAEFEVKKFADDPTKAVLFRDMDDDLVLNQWRPYVMPPRPAEDRFEIVKFVEDWLDLIYPGRREFIIKSWAHAYQRPAEKQNVGFVWGGNQGIGKDTLLTIGFHVLASQRRVSNIKHNQLDGNFEEFLLNPIIIVNEFHQYKGDDGLMIVRFKAYCAAPPNEFLIDIKYSLLRRVRNIHRVHITTNMEDRFKRENGDRRFYVMKSHATKEQVREFVGGRIGPQTNLASWIEDGRGDAFAHYLMTVDLTGFDPSRLPPDAEDYDEVQKGFAIQPALAAALDEIAATFGQREVAAELRKSLSDMEMEDWPEFVSSQQLMHTNAYYDFDVDGKPLKQFVSNQGWLNIEMSTAGYQEIVREDGRTQFKSTRKPKKADGIRAATSRLFIRKDRILPGEKVVAMRERAKEFLNVLTDYWETTAGFATYVDKKKDWYDAPGMEDAAADKNYQDRKKKNSA